MRQGELLGWRGQEELEQEKAFVPEPEADELGEDSSEDESQPELDQGGWSGAR